MTHFWKAFSKSDVEHAFKGHPLSPMYIHSACGMLLSADYDTFHAGTRHCKKCEKIIRRKEDAKSD